MRESPISKLRNETSTVFGLLEEGDITITKGSNPVGVLVGVKRYDELTAPPDEAPAVIAQAPTNDPLRAKTLRCLIADAGTHPEWYVGKVSKWKAELQQLMANKAVRDSPKPIWEEVVGA